MTTHTAGQFQHHVEGADRECAPGDILHFPSQCRHCATMLDDEVVLIDIFSPVRDEFLSNVR